MLYEVITSCGFDLAGKSMRARYLVPLILILGIGAAVWWIKRPTPIPVVLADVDRGTVEDTVSNTRAGEIEACQRAKLSTIAGGRIEYIGVVEGQKRNNFV